MEDRGEILYEIGPKFDIFYELTSPTGKKIRSSITFVIIAIILKILTICFKGTLMEISSNLVSNTYTVLSVVLWILVVFSILLLVVRILFQALEYKGIKYKFYDNCLTIENSFLNQTKKTIEYSNIKEVEIRRTVIDRILNYGIIIVYTNAEKSFSSATVIYAVKDIQKHYDEIEKLIHNNNK